jgi:hypothetical protein
LSFVARGAANFAQACAWTDDAWSLALKYANADGTPAASTQPGTPLRIDRMLPLPSFLLKDAGFVEHEPCHRIHYKANQRFNYKA